MCCSCDTTGLSNHCVNGLTQCNCMDVYQWYCYIIWAPLFHVTYKWKWQKSEWSNPIPVRSITTMKCMNMCVPYSSVSSCSVMSMDGTTIWSDAGVPTRPSTPVRWHRSYTQYMYLKNNMFNKFVWWNLPFKHWWTGGPILETFLRSQDNLSDSYSSMATMGVISLKSLSISIRLEINMFV